MWDLIYRLPLDTQLILQTSSDIYAPLSFADSVRNKFITSIANNLGKKDWISIYQVTRMLAGLKN
jgi:hypothetical protein